MAKYEVSDKSGCKAGALIIDPTNNAESVLLKKVTGMPTCGLAMPPPPTTALSGDDLTCIQNWVNSF